MTERITSIPEAALPPPPAAAERPAAQPADRPAGPAPAHAALPVSHHVGPRVTDRRGHRRPLVPWSVLLAGLLLVPPALAAAISATESPTYAAAVDLILQPDPTSSTDTMDRTLATHQVLLEQRPLLQEVADGVDWDPDDLADALEVEAVGESNVLRLQVADEDADRARRAAQLLADRYLNSSDAGAAPPGDLAAVAPAAVLPDRVGPQPLRAAAAGAVAGLLLGALLLLLRSRGERTRPSGR